MIFYIANPNLNLCYYCDIIAIMAWTNTNRSLITESAIMCLFNEGASDHLMDVELSEEKPPKRKSAKKKGPLRNCVICRDDRPLYHFRKCGKSYAAKCKACMENTRTTR
jgi:hypothetical protein